MSEPVEPVDVPSTKPTKRGRPKVEIDLEHVRECAQRQMDFRQIAGALRVSESTIKRRYKREKKFREAVDGGRDGGHAQLRAALWRTGVVDRNPQILIFLACNHLNMKREAVMPEDFNRNAGVGDIREKMIERLTTLARQQAEERAAGDQAPVN